MRRSKVARPARAFCAFSGALLWSIPVAAQAEQRRQPALRPKFTLEQLRRTNCEAEMAIRAETAGIDLSGLARAIQVAFVAISPHVGLMARVDGEWRALLLMPVSVPIGPVGATRRLEGWHGCFHEEESFRPFRLSVEPGLVLQKYPTGFVRASFRSIWHPLDSWLGLGAGFGPIADWQGSPALGFSSELLLQFGACCGPPFWQLSLRYDQYPSDRERAAFVLVFGPTVW